MREGWKEVKLDEIAEIYSGFAFKSKEMTSEKIGIPLVKIKNIFDRKVSKEYDTYLLKEFDKPKFEKYKLLQGDILVAMTGQGSVGRIGKMHSVKDKIYVNQRVGIVRVNEQFAVKEFVYQQLATKENESIYFNLALGAGQPNLSPADIGNKIINLPPLPTQQRIAEILSGYDDLIENNLKRIKILEEMAQQTYEEWFVRMRFPGHESAVINPETRLPEGWEKVKLGEIADFKYGSMPKKENISDSGYPVFSGYRNTGFSNKYNVSKKSLIVVARGVGGTGDVKFTPQKCWLTNLSILLNLKNDEFINYLYYYLKAANLRSLDSGAAQSQITIVSLEPFPILIPDIQIIIKFNSLVEPMFKSIENLQNQRLREARDILLPRLMMGMIEVENVKPNAGKIVKLEPSKKVVSKEFKEAVLIACLTERFGSEKYPLGRKRYTKLSYLFHRYSDNKIEDYLRKAAGPYNPKTKYAGPEKIALNSKYIQSWKGANGTTGFITAEKIEDAKNYFTNYWQIEDLEWLTSTFKFKSNDELELYATVDNSLVELAKNKEEFTVFNVLKIIQSEKEWEAKLEREIFNDQNIEKTINYLTTILNY